MTVMLMMRLLLLVMTLAGFTLTFLAKGPGVLALGLLLGFVGLFGLIFAIAAARVSASARPEALMAVPEDLAAMRARRAAAKPVAAPPAKDSAPQNRSALQ